MVSRAANKDIIENYFGGGVRNLSVLLLLIHEVKKKSKSHNSPKLLICY